jgi:catechol 2,3-dioxygenase-like lactoylglutathione lyase family enzyme
MKFEVTVLPVADPDRSQVFYQGLGWRLDADIPIDEQHRIVQFTPPGSPASIQFGPGTTTMTPGAMRDMFLIVEDIQAARDELIRHGADVSDVWHGPGPTMSRSACPVPTRTTVRTAASRRSLIPTGTVSVAGDH